MAAVNPIINGPVLTATGRTHSRSPSRSPRRLFLSQTPDNDNFYRDLSPSKTLRAIVASSDPSSETSRDDVKLIKSIESASLAEKDFAQQVAESSKYIKDTQKELEQWRWNTNQDPEATLSHGLYMELVSPRSWGGLDPQEIEAREQRLIEIRDDLDDINMEQQKNHVLKFHAQDRSPLSTAGSLSELQSTATAYQHLDGLTALVTSTILQSLPYYAKLLKIITTWSARLAVSKQIPFLASELAVVGIAFKSSGDFSHQHTTIQSFGLFRESFETMKKNLGTKVAKLGRRIDAMLDVLEGRPETLPDSWIDLVEEFEVKYSNWVVDAEKQVMLYEYRLDLAQHNQTLLRKQEHGTLVKKLKRQSLDIKLPGDWVSPMESRPASIDLQQLVEPSDLLSYMPPGQSVRKTTSSADRDATTIEVAAQELPSDLTKTNGEVAVKSASFVANQAGQLAQAKTFEDNATQLSRPTLSLSKDATTTRVTDILEDSPAVKPSSQLIDSSERTCPEKHEDEASQVRDSGTFTASGSPPNDSNLSDVQQAVDRSNDGLGLGLTGTPLTGNQEEASITLVNESTREQCAVIPEFNVTTSSEEQNRSMVDSLGSEAYLSSETFLRALPPQSSPRSTSPSSPDQLSGGSSPEVQQASLIHSMKPMQVITPPAAEERVFQLLHPERYMARSKSDSMLQQLVVGKVRPGKSPMATPPPETVNEADEVDEPEAASSIHDAKTEGPNRQPMVRTASVTSIASFPRSKVRKVDLIRLEIPRRLSEPAIFLQVTPDSTVNNTPTEQYPSRVSSLRSQESSISLRLNPDLMPVDESDESTVPSSMELPREDSIDDLLVPRRETQPASPSLGFPPFLPFTKESFAGDEPIYESQPLSPITPTYEDIGMDITVVPPLPSSIPNSKTIKTSSQQEESKDGEAMLLPMRSRSSSTPTEIPADSQLDRQIGQILSTVAAPIKFQRSAKISPEKSTSNRRASAQSTPTKPKRSSFLGRPTSSLSTNTPESAAVITLTPASNNPAPSSSSTTSRSSRRSNGASDSAIKLYHLNTPGKSKPIKLFVRLVGEHGDRVMVRVGGGWADLGDYLREYAAHHSRMLSSPTSAMDGGSGEAESIEGMLSLPIIRSGTPIAGLGSRSQSPASFVSDAGIGPEARPMQARIGRRPSMPLALIPKRGSSVMGGMQGGMRSASMQHVPLASRSSSSAEKTAGSSAGSSTARTPTLRRVASQTIGPYVSPVRERKSSFGSGGASVAGPAADGQSAGTPSLLGPSAGRKTELTPEKKKWLDDMVERAKKWKKEKGSGNASSGLAGPSNLDGFGDMGTVGNTRRMFSVGGNKHGTELAKS